MTVQQLIDELQAVEDKTRLVVGSFGDHVINVIESEDTRIVVLEEWSD